MMLVREKKNCRKLTAVVTAQTKFNLYRLAEAAGYGTDIGRVIDKLTRDRMLMIHDIAIHRERK